MPEKNDARRIRAARIAMVATGVVVMLCAVLGLLYNLMTFASSRSSEMNTLATELDAPHWRTAFHVMSAICVTSFVVLLASGVDLVKQRVSAIPVVLGVWAFEVIYFFAGLATSMAFPSYRMSIAAATGIANGGLMFQFGWLLPLWGSVLLGWAWYELRRTETAGHHGAQ